MLIVPIKRICTQQPQGAAQVDWSNPITRGLVYCGNSATTPGSKIACISGVSFSANQAAYQPGITIGANIPATEGLTLLSVGLINYANDGSNNNFGIRIGTLNNYRFLVGVAGYSSKLQAYAKIQYTDYSVSTTTFANHGAGNRPLVLAATYERNQAAGLKCFANNVIIGSAATSDKNIFSEAAPLVINSADGGSNNLIFPTLLNLYWSRSLSTEEIASLSANPWQIFRAPDSRIFVPTGGTSTATYTIYPTGSLVFNNTTPSIKMNVLPTLGNITYSGTNSLIFSNGATTYTITPSGSINYIDSSVLEKERVLYTLGNITYSGNTIPIYDRTLSVNGLITYTGITNQIRIKMIYPVGNISYTGTAPIYVPGSEVITTRLPLTGVGN